MFKHFHALFGRRNAIDLNKSLDSLDASGSGIKTRKGKKNSQKDKKKSKKRRGYEPSAELTEEVATPQPEGANCSQSQGSHSPSLKQKPRKISLENFFNHSTSGRRSRTVSKLSTTFTEDFWDRHFAGRRFAPWQDFRAAFLGDYGALIEDFAPERTHWILAIVHEDIFRGMDDVYRCYYENFCKKHEDGDRLWLSIKQYASERIFREGVVESMFE